MLAVAIKNVVLVILIITIIHFLLKSFGIPSKATYDPKPVYTQPSFPLPTLSYEKTETFMQLPEQAPAPAPMPQKVLKQDDPSTCNPGIGNISSEGKTITSDCVLDQPNPNAFLLLNTYEDDNQKWMDNVDLYDEFNDHLANFTCSKFEVKDT
jgi:hypothetical protein